MIGTLVVIGPWGGIAVNNGLILVFDPGIPKMGGFWRHFYQFVIRPGIYIRVADEWLIVFDLGMPKGCIVVLIFAV